jgi:hypothetical protein
MRLAALILGLCVAAPACAITPEQARILFSTGPRCVSGIADNFNDNTQDTNLWTVNNPAGTGAGTTVSETSGQLQLVPAVSDASPKSNGYLSATAFDMTGRRVFVRLVQRTETTGATDLVFAVYTGIEYVRFRTTGTDLAGQRKNGGSNTAAFSLLTYNATKHGWLSIREAGGLFYLDAAPSYASNPPARSDWVNLGSVSYGSVNPTSVKIWLGASNLSSTATPGTGIFDGLCTGT